MKLHPLSLHQHWLLFVLWHRPITASMPKRKVIARMAVTLSFRISTKDLWMERGGQPFSLCKHANQSPKHVCFNLKRSMPWSTLFRLVYSVGALLQWNNHRMDDSTAFIMHWIWMNEWVFIECQGGKNKNDCQDLPKSLQLFKCTLSDAFNRPIQFNVLDIDSLHF